MDLVQNGSTLTWYVLLGNESGKGSMQGGRKWLQRLLEECHRKKSKGSAVICICCDLVSKKDAGHRE